MKRSRVVLAVFTAVILMLVLSVALTTPVSAGPSGFVDIRGAWGETDIQKLQSAKVVTGFEDGTFRPETYVSRAEFACLLSRVKGWPVPTGTYATFSDVDAHKWYAGYVKAAYLQNSLVGNGKAFRPAANITLGEVVAAVVRARYSDDEVNSVKLPVLYLSKFSDIDETPNWARRYLAAAVKHGMYPFRVCKDKLRAKEYATRSEVAVVLAKLVRASSCDDAADVSPVKVMAVSVPVVMKTKGSDSAEPAAYTGLVVDARGLKAARSMSPRIINEFAATVWELGVRDIAVFNANTYYGNCDKMSENDKDYVLDSGIVSYGKDASDATVKSRCGANPLIVRGIRKGHSADDWIVVSREDGKAIEAADKVSGFRKEFKVSILLD